MSEVFYDDPYGLTGTDRIPPADFDERLRPLVLLYEIGKAQAERGVLPHHTALGGNSIGVLIDARGRIAREARSDELPLVVPASKRAGLKMVPHIGADDLGTLLSTKYRPEWLKKLDGFGDADSAALAMFISSLPLYDKLTKAQKDSGDKPNPEVFGPVQEALGKLGLRIEAKVFSTEVFPKIVALDASGRAMCEQEEWRVRHIADQSSTLASERIGRCSITGRIGPLARLTGSVQGPFVSAIASSPGGKSAVVSVNRQTFEGLYNDGLRDASISVEVAELISVGLETMLSESAVSMKVGPRSMSKLRATFSQGDGRNKKTLTVSMLAIVERHGTNTAENLLTALARTIRAPFVDARIGDDGSKIKGFYNHPDLDRLELLSEATVLFAVFGGSTAGVSFDAWHELSGVQAGERIIAWSKAQRKVSGSSFGFDVHALSSVFAIGGGSAFLRSITHGEKVPAWIARSALDELFKPDSLDRSIESAKHLSTLGLFLFGTDHSQQEHIMTSLRDTPAFRLGAWLGAIQTAWEKGVGEGKQDRGPVSGIRSLASKPGARWAELTFRYEESIGPKSPKWAEVAVSKAAAAFLDLEMPFPDTLNTLEQATFVLGYQSRWDKKTTDQDTTIDTDEANQS